MQFTTLLTTVLPLLATLPSTLACLQSYGSISTTGQADGINVIDNGATVCSSDWGWQIDWAGNVDVNCLPNYVFAVTTDGSLAYYFNTVNSYSWTQEASGDLDEFSWNVEEFC